MAAHAADAAGTLYTGPNTEDTPTIVEATAFSGGIVIAQVNELVDGTMTTLPRIDIPADWVNFVVKAPRPNVIEPLFTRDPAQVSEIQVLMAMMAITGIYAEIRVMRIPAMARVTKLPEEMLKTLSRSNPVRTRRAELRRDGRRACALARRPAGRLARRAGPYADHGPARSGRRRTGWTPACRQGRTARVGRSLMLAGTMVCLRRHQLARLTDAGWNTLLQRPRDELAQQCLTHWATHRLPLVVTRQCVEIIANGWIALGLPAPAQWDRRRLPLQVPHGALRCLDEFPRLEAVRRLLPPSPEAPAQERLDVLEAGHSTVRVFGSFGWQAISGLTHVRPESDLDLCIAVDGMEEADALAHRLQSFGATKPRLDGELMFGDGAAVAWREWIDWRTGRARAVMVKRLDGVALQQGTAWCNRAALPE